MTPEGLPEILAKIGSAGAGALIGLALMPPVSIKDALRRGFVSLIFGALCYPLAAWYLKFERTTEIDIGGIVITAALSWWILGALVKALELWKPKQ